MYLFPQSVPIGIFDFCETIASITKLDSVLKYDNQSVIAVINYFREIFSEFVTLFRPSNPLAICAIQRAVLEHCLSEWISVNDMKDEGSYEGLFPVMEDPVFIDSAMKSIYSLFLQECFFDNDRRGPRNKCALLQ